MADMSEMNTSDLYAVVDLSKKKIKKTANNENKPPSDSDIALYSVPNRNDNEDNKLKPKNNPQSSIQESEFGKIFSINGFMVLSLIITWVILAITFIMVIIVFHKISTLENVSMAATTQQTNAIWTLQNMTSSLENRVGEINSTIDNIYDILDNVTFTLLSLQGTSIDTYYSSCSHILNQYSSYKSGKYILKLVNDELMIVHCDMTNTFGDNSLGWMRIAKLDVNNCPLRFKTRIDNTISTCIVTDDSSGCTTITYPTFNIRYTKVAGRVRGYQIGTLDGFMSIGGITRSDDNPVDGINIQSDSEHVWTFAAGCYCAGIRPEPIGNNYTCYRPSSCNMGQFCDKHLWQSQKCGTPPSSWFLRTLPPTTADITVRVCRDQERADEDLAISSLELYVQ